VNIPSDNIRGVAGAVIVFDEPNGAGSGFTIDSWERVARDLGSRSTVGVNNNVVLGANTTRQLTNGFVYKFNSLGSGYTESPVVTITDPTAENVYAEAHLDYAITGLTIGTAGAGLAANEVFDLVYDEVYDSADNATGTRLAQVISNGALTVSVDGGVLNQDSVNNALADAIENGDFAFDADNLAALSDNARNLRLVSQGGTTEAVIDVSAMKSRIRAIAFQGDNFTNPSFAFTGGGSTNQASLEISQFQTQWTFALNNENIEAYSSIPGISFNFSGAALNPNVSNSQNVDIFDLDDNYVTTTNIVNRLEVNGDGEVVYQDAAENNRTNFSSTEAPTAVIVNPQAGIAPNANLTVNANGEVSAININNFGSTLNGSNTGYTSRLNAVILPAADGAPGEGAEINTGTGVFNPDGTYRWNGNANITEGGSGYLQDLNQENNRIGLGQRGFSTSAGSINNSITLNEGQTFRQDIDYGTGNKIGSF
jgi:hypothetical protein